MARILFLKASPPSDSRWITVHPNGPGTKGQPILVQPASDGAYRVVGGADGKLNYLKLTGVKSEADYKTELHERAKGRQEKKQRQRERDKKDGLTGNKKTAHEAISGQLRTHEAKFVQTVAAALGWDAQDMRFPEEKYQNASEAAVKAAAQKHGRGLFARAKQAVEVQRQALVQDAEARSEAGLGEVPLTSARPDQLSVQDLDPVDPTGKGLGFSADYGKRAAAAGATPEEVRAEAQATRAPRPEGTPDPAAARKALGEGVAKELEAIRDPGPTVNPAQVVDAKKAVELLKAAKELRALQKAAAEQRRKVDGAREPVEPKAFVLEVGGKPVDADVVKDIENDLRTVRTRAFLDEAARDGNAAQMQRHVGVGAYNSINALSLAAGGAAMLDRSTVDVLGIAGAAQVLARRFATDLTPEEMENIRDAMQSFHVSHYMAASETALREARSWHEMAQEIELGEAATGTDLAVAQELNAKRREFTSKATEVLGTALGEMEANAALVVALKQPKKAALDVSMGSASVESAITQARAIGLERGDYTVERIGANTVLTVSGAGMERLARPVSRDDLARVKESLDIIEGRADEDGWLPDGVARRPDMAMPVKPGTAPQLAQPFKGGGDPERSIRDYIGGRAADGDPAAEIMAGLLSEDTLRKTGDRSAFIAALDKIAPLYGEDGKMVRAEAHQAAFEQMADDFVEHTQGGTLAAIHRQKFPVDQVAVDALHRALAEHPDGIAAFKPVGELTPQDQGALRAVFAKEYGRSDPKAEAMRAELEKLEGQEPEREVDDMFGRGENPAWREWRQDRDAKAAELNAASMTWAKYLTVMGGPANAYAAMQDVVKSGVLDSFAKHHNTLRPDAPLKLGRTVIRHDLNHLDALDTNAREKRLAAHRDLVDSLRNRVAGRYAAGGVADQLEAARAADEAASQAQMGLFGAEEIKTTPGSELSDAEPAPERAIEMGERRTIGHAAERQIAGMMPHVGRNFRAGEPTKLWHPAMSGAFVGRQRAVKLIAKNRRVALGLGVGSGKTSIALSSFAHLHAQEKAKRGLFVVPSVVQGQFHGEALTMLEPGKFQWHCDPGATREERIAGYKNKDNHFSVVTHQAFRDDMLHLAAKREGSTPDRIAKQLAAMSTPERKTYMRELMDAEGMDHDYLAVDEGHSLLNRRGKEDSRMANVIDGVSHGMSSYVNMTADPVKNDPSEAFDVLHKMDPERYADRDAFLRRYGVDTAASRDELRREMVRHFYTGKIEPGVAGNKSEVRVEMDAQQHQRIAMLNKAAATARLARMKGEVDVPALRTLSPSSFAGIPEAQHADVAKELNRSLGILHDTAIHHAVNGGAKTEALARVAAERKGRPGVVFAHHLDRVQEITKRLQRDGHRVVTLTGADSSQDKDRKKRAFQAGEHDIIVMSDAGAVGANLQRGKWVAQYDTPPTAMTHAQRNGRVHRLGQTEDVDLIDLVANHPSEVRARRRLSHKYELRDIMTSPLDGLDDRGIAGFLHRRQAGEQEAAEPLHPPAPRGDRPRAGEQASMF